jgi:hypothetical protein
VRARRGRKFGNENTFPKSGQALSEENKAALPNKKTAPEIGLSAALIEAENQAA